MWRRNSGTSSNDCSKSMKSTSRHSRRFSLSGLLGILFLGCAGAAIGAVQDSESYFHQGARHFLATNEITQAKQVVTNGLKFYPNDAKLKKLWELLNQKGDGQGQDQQKQDQQDKDKENKDQKSKDQQQQKDQKDQAQQDKKSEEQKKQ